MEEEDVLWVVAEELILVAGGVVGRFEVQALLLPLLVLQARMTARMRLARMTASMDLSPTLLRTP